MGLHIKKLRKTLWAGVLLSAFVVAGCAGIEPYEPRNDREEGPERGLFSGSEGEFVIYRRADKPETGSEAAKISDESADGEQQTMDKEEK